MITFVIPSDMHVALISGAMAKCWSVILMILAVLLLVACQSGSIEVAQVT
jgi:hypothetical protein